MKLNVLEIAHIKEAFSFFFFLQFFQIKAFEPYIFLSFLIILWRENFVLSVSKFDQRANHAFEMTCRQWKSTDTTTTTPHLQLSCIFYHTAFMRAASVTSPLELLPRVIFIDAIKSKKYLTSVIIT